MPDICMPYRSDYPWDEEQHPPPDEDGLDALKLAVDREALMLYVLDEEALRKGMIKVMWFGHTGNLLWWNWLEPGYLQDWNAVVNGLGIRLDRILDYGSHENGLYWKCGLIDFG